MFAVIAVASALGAAVWGRSALRLRRTARRIAAEVKASRASAEVGELAVAAFRKDLHTALLYAVTAVANAAAAGGPVTTWDLPRVLVLFPVAMSVYYGRGFLGEARLAERRAHLERRAEEILSQGALAPQRWAARLAPSDLPEIEGFEIGRVYEAGAGAMAGDFYDVYRTGPSRFAAVIGDVSGHGIEPSITAFQVKYLLRVFLREYRDPGQALEELNAVLSSQGRPEDFVSLVVVTFDPQAASIRYASAGHPPAWFWNDGEVRPLRATGPLLTLDPNATFASKEFELRERDVLVLYTDGLVEARQGEMLFGEDRVGQILRKDPGEAAGHLCKVLLEAAQDFASEPIADDIAILAIRRT